ncbi:hypothetical protein GA0061070_103655 [Kosakonia oryziphila]|uniref:Uncharacterized protein n=1 Tax=Kosakonia oryziphila TaxID=1005667 RepID=A0A1C4FHE5_9ENTR|nr:hypothetical protein GA0061070_103655 [Kosakonia oryziphila]
MGKFQTKPKRNVTHLLCSFFKKKNLKKISEAAGCNRFQKNTRRVLTSIDSENNCAARTRNVKGQHEAVMPIS